MSVTSSFRRRNKTMKKRVLASITKNGSVNWNYDWTEIDIETMVRIQMFAEDIAHYQATRDD